MLDQVMQSSPLAMVLTNDKKTILYSNTIARGLFNHGERIEGCNFIALVEAIPGDLNTLLRQHHAGLIPIPNENDEGEEELYHVSHNEFSLNDQYHHLYLFKQLTRELNRQEVDTWKKVIRVISHEINNALAPLSSMAYSGKKLAKEDPKLIKIFDTISERTKHLNQFIQGYSRFAKLPQPRIGQIDWHSFVTSLQEQFDFSHSNPKAIHRVFADSAQLEQVITNLIKNAQESESPSDDICLAIDQEDLWVHITLCDRGKGMNEHVLKNALLPFYSTKQEGTGLGLALCREIVEAHNGRIKLFNRVNGGLEVKISLPNEGKI